MKSDANRIPSMRRAAKFLLDILICLTVAATAVADETPRVEDPASFIGINCGKSGAHDTKKGIERYFLKRNIATLNLAQQLALGWARCGGGPEQWYVGGKPSPDRFDVVLNHAGKVGVRVYLYIEYRGDINSQEITDFDWHETGRAFAAHFGTRVACYGIMNEVDHVASPHSPEEVATAVAAFSEGVHSVDPDLLVSSPSMGGTPMQIERADAFLRAMGRLINVGQINVLNLHSYQDSRPKKPHFSNIDNSSEWAPSRNFLRAKRAAGITHSVAFAAGEFNYRNWDGSDADRARGFMTTLWDQLMVVAAADSDDPVGLFSMPYNIPDDRPDRQTTMAKRFSWKEDGSFEWEPNEKGRVLQEMLRLTSGMEFIHCDPHGKGIAILKGNGRKAWVWQNRSEFSSLASEKRIEISGIPRTATRLIILTHESLAKPHASIRLVNQTNVRFDVESLPSDQTLLIMADSDDSDETGDVEAAD